jgi:hypothetical protein
MIDPSLVLFAIESAIKLGRKVYEVLVDETVERPLVLPVGNLFQSVQVVTAKTYFGRPENAHLITGNGPYAKFTDAELLVAYKTLLEIDRRLDSVEPNQAEAMRLVTELGRFEQMKKGFGPKSPAQRILGTVVEIGIDYFASHPEALGKDSRARQLVTAFITGLTDTDFAEGSLPEIAGDVLGAAFKTLGDNSELVADDERLQVLLVGVAGAIAAEIDKAPTPGAKDFKSDLFRRIGTGIIRGGATAFEQNLDLFLPRENARSGDPDHPAVVRALVSGTLAQFLEGIQGNEDLFTTESVELLFRSALSAVGENAELFGKNNLLQKFIEATTKALTDTQGTKLFSSQTIAVILREGLEVLGENVETLIDPKHPEQQFLATAVSAMANSLATTLAGTGNIKDLLSSRQVVELARVVFAEVAAHPEQLLGENLNANKRTALAQVISSVASALGDDPTQLVNGSSFLELVRIALRVSVKNADQLLNLETANPKTNLLFQTLQQAAEAVLAGDSRKIVSREVFVELVDRLLPVVSGNLGMLLDGKEPVSETIGKALALANDVLKTRINGANLPVLVEELLRLVLRSELNLDEQTALERSALAILNHA